MPEFSPEKFGDIQTQIQRAPQEQSPVVPDLRRDVELSSEQSVDATPQETRDIAREASPHVMDDQPLPSTKRAQVTSIAPSAKTPQREEIEAILSENVMEVYSMLTPQEQEKFRAAGEEAVTKIEQLVVQFKATARTVLQIIRQWLMTIPRINVFFLEQESKIKTDRILKSQQKFKAQHHKTHI